MYGDWNGVFYVGIWINYNVVYERFRWRVVFFKLCMDCDEKFYCSLFVLVFYYGIFSLFIVYEVCEKEFGSGLS